MPETFNPTVFLALQRVRAKTASARAEAALARLGGGKSSSGQTAARRSGELFYSDNRGPFGWLYADGEDPDLVVRDSAFIKQMFKIWKRRPRIAQGRSTIHLSSGREFVFDHKSGRVLRP
jgi:hypothetical protein